MTQAPLESTMADFWLMALQYNIGTIVMLNNLQEGDQVGALSVQARTTLSHPRVINIKYPLQPHQKFNITQYEELGFS